MITEFNGWAFVLKENKIHPLVSVNDSELVQGVFITRKRARYEKQDNPLLNKAKIVKVKVTLETI